MIFLRIYPSKKNFVFCMNKVACIKIEKISEVKMWKDICRYFHAWKSTGGKIFPLLLCMCMESSRHANVSPYFANNSMSICL